MENKYIRNDLFQVFFLLIFFLTFNEFFQLSLIHLLRDLLVYLSGSFNSGFKPVTSKDIEKNNFFLPRVIIDRCKQEWNESELFNTLRENEVIRELDFLGRGWAGNMTPFLQNNFSILKVEYEYSKRGTEEKRVSEIEKRNKHFQDYLGGFHLCEKNLVLTLCLYQSFLKKYSSPQTDRCLLLIACVRNNTELASILMTKGVDIYSSPEWLGPLEVNFSLTQKKKKKKRFC